MIAMTVTAERATGVTPVSILVPDDVLTRALMRATGDNTDVASLLPRLLSAGLDALDNPLLLPDAVAAITDPDPLAQARLRCDAGGALSKAGRDVVAVRDDALVEMLARGAKPSEGARLARVSRAQVARMAERVDARRAELIARGEVVADEQPPSTTDDTDTGPADPE